MNTHQSLLFWALGLIWGTSFLWIKIAVTEVSPGIVVAFRTLFASLGLALVVLLNKKFPFQWQAVRGRLPDFLVLGFFNIALPFVLIAWAEQFVDSSVASILNSTVPLFTIIIAPIFVKDDPITAQKIIGLLIGFAGVVLIMSPNIQGGWNQDLLGQSAIIIAALSYAVATVYARRRAHGFAPQIQSLLQLSMSTIIVWIFVLLTENPIVVPQKPITWLALLWLGLLGSCLAYIIYFSLLYEIGPTRMSMVTYIPPLVGVLLGVLFLGETLNWQSLAGAGLILSGIIFINRGNPFARKPFRSN